MHIFLYATEATSEPCFIQRDMPDHLFIAHDKIVVVDGQRLALDSIDDCWWFGRVAYCSAPQPVLIALMRGARGWRDHSLNNYMGFESMPESRVLH